MATSASPDLRLRTNYKHPYVDSADDDDDAARDPYAEPQNPNPAPADTTTPADDLLRKCRICFETSAPPYPPSPELGRLISPCNCRGSGRYVHTECLQLWRQTSSEAFYKCPTCLYEYRLRRLAVGSAISSSAATFAATLCILLAVVWALGFVSGPILATYLDLDAEEIELPVARGGWAEHFLRGLASLGLLGFAKVLYIVGPGSFFGVRTSRARGQERVGRLTWIVIAVGVVNFFVWLWRRVESAVQWWMAKSAADVMEVGDGGDGDERPVVVPWSTWILAEVEGARVKAGQLWAGLWRPSPAGP